MSGREVVYICLVRWFGVCLGFGIGFGWVCLLVCFAEVKVSLDRKISRLLSQTGSWAFETVTLQPTTKAAAVQEQVKI